MSPVPFGRRARLTSAVGPDAKGSNPGFAWIQMPEKSGMDSDRSLCPKMGVTKAAASVSTKGKFGHRKSIAFLLRTLPRTLVDENRARAGLRAWGGRFKTPACSPPVLVLPSGRRD